MNRQSLVLDDIAPASSFSSLSLIIEHDIHSHAEKEGSEHPFASPIVAIRRASLGMPAYCGGIGLYRHLVASPYGRCLPVTKATSIHGLILRWILPAIRYGSN